MRRVAVALLLGLAGLMLPVGVIALWAGSTVYDSDTFSTRAVELLDSATVRKELATQLTEQLVLAGNRQAGSFRPAFQLAIETAIDTDTFRSIFRSAIKRTHAAVLNGNSGSATGLNLADSVAIITSTLSLPGNAKPGDVSSGALGSSLDDVTKRLSDLGIWKLDDTIDLIAAVGCVGALGLAVVAVVLARDRRRAVRLIGWVLVVDGLALVAVLQLLEWWVERKLAGSSIASAAGAAVNTATQDLHTAGLWVAGYGVVVAAAASRHGRRQTPAEIYRRVQAWGARKRQTTRGALLLALVALFAGFLLLQDPLGNLSLAVTIGGLALTYLGVAELLRVARAVVVPAARRRRWPHVAAVGGVVVVVLALLTVGLVATTARAARRADAAGTVECNGEADWCKLPLDQVVFPGSHNSMSSSLYPGFLFAEQIDTIAGQLDAGVRALLIDTHYGVPSSVRLPGADTSLVLTDRAAELATPPGEDIDPAVAQRAARLASRAPRAANSKRDIYLCHNYCELGAVAFSSVLADMKKFIDTHPDEVVMVIIQDATTPADTVAAITEAGLADRAVTLTPGQPLPTLGDLVAERRNVVFFAEEGGPGAPPWYQQAYRWFQETPYSFKATTDFSCPPNRGPADAPMFLVNHWITESPPDPGAAAKVNAAGVLGARVEQCDDQRGLSPTIIAADFAERGAVVATARALTDAHVHDRADEPAPPSTPGSTAPPTTAPPETVPTTVAVPPAPPPPSASVITTLTGGDPARFCPALAPTATAVVGWAQAILGDAPAERGLTDLVYAPLLARELTEYVDAAPAELAERATPLLARANAALGVLHQLGLDASVGTLADAARSGLTAAGTPDGATVRLALTDLLRSGASVSQIDQAAQAFEAAQPDPATLMDLGYVPDDVGAQSGFDCGDVIATI